MALCPVHLAIQTLSTYVLMKKGTFLGNLWHLYDSVSSAARLCLTWGLATHWLRLWWWWARCWGRCCWCGSWRSCGCCRWTRGAGRWWWPDRGMGRCSWWWWLSSKELGRKQEEEERAITKQSFTLKKTSSSLNRSPKGEESNITSNKHTSYTQRSRDKLVCF